jgi:hypothetical protein
MKVILIVGKSNAGKSTLVRSLSGLGQGSNAHSHPPLFPNQSPVQNDGAVANIVDLDWRIQEHPNFERITTLCVNASLNETNPPLLPNALVSILTDYEKVYGCKKAIICLSASRQAANISLAAFDPVITGHNFAQSGHQITHTVFISAGTNAAGGMPQLAIFNHCAPLEIYRGDPPAWAQNGNPPTRARNDIAQTVRNHIDLV